MNIENDAPIRALYQRLMEGWNRGDAESFAEPFVNDADFIAFDGTHFKGKNAIIESHRPLFDKWMKGTRLVGECISIRFLNPEIALLHATGGTIMKGRAGPSPERDSIQTMVAVKRNGEWRLIAFQNTRVRPIGRNAGGTMVWFLSDWLWKFLCPR
jgi:uncharacterized protein (TIGR02246 family)